MDERDASVEWVCRECERKIAVARCLEGWCVDCGRSKGTPPWADLYCQGHRCHVERDWHCSDWVSDK